MHQALPFITALRLELCQWSSRKIQSLGARLCREVQLHCCMEEFTSHSPASDPSNEQILLRSNGSVHDSQKRKTQGRSRLKNSLVLLTDHITFSKVSFKLKASCKMPPFKSVYHIHGDYFHYDKALYSFRPTLVSSNH